MIIDTGNILLIGAVLLFFSIIAGKAGFRFGVPVLLLFLGVGMLLATAWEYNLIILMERSSSV